MPAPAPVVSAFKVLTWVFKAFSLVPMPVAAVKVKMSAIMVSVISLIQPPAVSSTSPLSNSVPAVMVSTNRSSSSSM